MGEIAIGVYHYHFVESAVALDPRSITELPFSPPKQRESFFLDFASLFPQKECLAMPLMNNLKIFKNKDRGSYLSLNT